MSLEDLSGEWRKLLQDKFLVLLLDDARDEGQVLPFLPGGSQYIVLVTGRHMPDVLIDKLWRYRLGVLDAAGARQMMKNIVRGSLMAGDLEAMDGIAKISDYLPQAIKSNAVQVASGSGFSFADKLAQLEASPNSLLASEEYTSKRSGGVAKSFEPAYMQLTDVGKLVLRRMALAPVPLINTEAVAALADLPAQAAVASLEELVAAALIQEYGDGFRYRMHDLTRGYARTLAGRDDPVVNSAAIDRMLAYYWAAATHGDSTLTRQPPPRAVEPPAPTVRHVFVDRFDCVVWLRAELSNLLTCADYVVDRADAGRRQDQLWVMLFAGALAGLLRNEGLWRRSIGLQTQALRMAERLQIPLAVANALSERAFLYRLSSVLSSAVADLERAIDIYRQVGGAAGETGEAHALNTYGVVLDELGNRDEGRQGLDRALEIYRRLGDRLGEANALHDLGMLELFAGDFNQAAQLVDQSLAIYKEVDQPLGTAHAFGNLAKVQKEIGADREAAKGLESARVLYLELGNRLGANNALIQRGAVLRRHDRRNAKKVLSNAIELSIEIGNQAGHVNALDELGELYLAQRRSRAALKEWERALALATEYGLKREEDRLAGKIARVRSGGAR